MRSSSRTPEKIRRAAPVAVLTLWLGSGCAVGAPPPEGPSPEADPAAETAETAAAAPLPVPGFSAAQARRGEEAFGTTCAECHATGEFRGRDFEFRWRRRTAWDFYRTVSRTMPEDAPGSLSDRQYVDVVAYILELNGHAPGEGELPADRETLDRILMDAGSEP